ncbi:hypothetical protein NEDG_00625 [Nematocida displodere]|uniref:Uncharacterized protein n=1 Tax=Nematocida displodere TaxID=1805483 RepID=A0A177EEC1_9MICR|nr:hypothetical protein NEDG_00625 [Nematocida displodere]
MSTHPETRTHPETYQYNVVLNTASELMVAQFPLLEKLPEVTSLKTKNQDTYAEADVWVSGKRVTMKGNASKTLSQYYVLSLSGKTLHGKKVDQIIQLRPVLKDTPETLKKAERKEKERGFALNETQEELENRMKNPNNVIDKLNKEEWKTYAVNQDRQLSILHQDQVASAPPATTRQPRPQTPLAAIQKVIYNARVVNVSVLKEIFPEATTDVIRKALESLATKTFGRYILRAEYFNDMREIFQGIMSRFVVENERVTLSITAKELSDPEESFFYVLRQLAHKEGHLFVLKGCHESF